VTKPTCEVCSTEVEHTTTCDRNDGGTMELCDRCYEYAVIVLGYGEEEKEDTFAEDYDGNAYNDDDESTAELTRV